MLAQKGTDVEYFGVTPMEDVALSMADCLARVRQKDEAAARSLVDHLYPLVIKVVRANLPRRASEEDLMQEIFLKVFAHLDQFRGEVPIEHWVSRIAVNHCLKALNAQRTRPEWRMADLSKEEADALEALSTSAAAEPHPTDIIGARELVDRLLEALSPKDRLVIRLLEMEDRTVEEIRHLTGWSATVIRVRAFRARQKLNRRFAKLKKEGQL